MPPSTPKKTAICYVRTSTLAQKQSETIEAQVDRCRTLIQRHDLELLSYGPQNDGWLRDDGVSGTLLDGRCFGQFLADLADQKVRPDYLVVYSLSRISRVDRVSKDFDKLRASHAAAAEIQSTLIGRGVWVLDEEGPIDPAALTFSLKATLASEEFKLIRSRTMAGKVRLLSQGRYARGGKPPYGYVQVPVNGVDRKQGYTLAPHPEDAGNLRQLLHWYIEGGFTYAARRATETGIPSPMSRTKRRNQAAYWSPTRWDPVSVQHIIRNVSAYLGNQTYEFDGQAYTLEYPALIDHDLYAAVLRRQKVRTLKRRATMLTTGFVDCECGGHIHARNSHGRHHARCPRGCGSMPQKALESHLWILTICRLIQIRQHEGERRRRDDSELISEAKAQVAHVQSQLDKLLELYLEGSLDKATYTPRNQAIQGQKAEAQSRLDQLIREREAAEKKRVTVETVEQRVGAVMAELVRAEPSLDRRREILGDILQGGRVILRWRDAHVTLTLPEFGALPPVTVRTDQQVWDQVLGGPVLDTHMATYPGLTDIEAALLQRIAQLGGSIHTHETLPDGTVRIVAEIPEGAL